MHPHPATNNCSFSADQHGFCVCVCFSSSFTPKYLQVTSTNRGHTAKGKIIEEVGEDAQLQLQTASHVNRMYVIWCSLLTEMYCTTDTTWIERLPFSLTIRLKNSNLPNNSQHSVNPYVSTSVNIFGFQTQAQKEHFLSQFVVPKDCCTLQTSHNFSFLVIFNDAIKC